MTIVTYAHRRKKQPRKKRAAPVLSVPAIVTHKKGLGPPIDRQADPEADARIVEFFARMGLTYVPPER